MGMHQPAVSAALRQLRDITGDALLVRSGTNMVPTDTGLHMIEPSARILEAAEYMFASTHAFDPRTAQITFRVGTSDFLDPLFLPRLVTQMKMLAPRCNIEISSLSEHAQYPELLSQGALDIVIGNWTHPNESLHRLTLFEDEVVSMVSQSNPVARRGWDADAWLGAEHIAPTSTHLGGRGVIDEYLHTMGLQRNIVARSQNFGIMPSMVASTLLVLTTGRHYCERYLLGHGGALPLVLMACPIPFPRMTYYQLWHERSHLAASGRWLRQLVKSVADNLRCQSNL